MQRKVCVEILRRLLLRLCWLGLSVTYLPFNTTARLIQRLCIGLAL